MRYVENYKTCMGVVLFREQEELVQSIEAKLPEATVFNSLLRDARSLVQNYEGKDNMTKTDIMRLIKLEQTVARLEGALAAILAYGLETKNDSDKTQ